MVFKILACAMALVLVASDLANAECTEYRIPIRLPNMISTDQIMKRVPNREPIGEPIREPIREPSRLPNREPIREPIREPSRLPNREPIREPIREPSRLPNREPIREPIREPSRLPNREPIRQPITEPSLPKISNSQDFCHLQSCRGKPNTECLFKNFDPSPRCGRVLTVGLTSEEKRVIVDEHNRLRMKVASGQEHRGAPGPQPAARNMQMLEWDDELAQTAQKWASQCQFQHDKCRNSPRYQVGQNLAYRSISSADHFPQITAKILVNDWYEEVQYYHRGSVHKYISGRGADNEQIGHYTQLVWAKTNKIGCGAMKTYIGGFYKFALACNYGPAGNFINEPVYATL